MVNVMDFLDKTQEIAKENPQYAHGGDGTNGRCDCIGLIIGAIRRAGGKWTGLHGSNWAARNAMAALHEIRTASDLRLGWAIYKYRDVFDVNYDLPTRYDGQTDERDYYHVGVVVSVNPLQIMHCTSGSGGSGIKVDTEIGKWRMGGPLKAVQYDEEVVDMEQMMVTATEGSTVNLRALPSTSAVVLERVQVGTVVDVLSTQGVWCDIKLPNGKRGWMIGTFLAKAENKPETDQSAPDTITLTISREAAKYLLERLKEVV